MIFRTVPKSAPAEPRRGLFNVSTFLIEREIVALYQQRFNERLH